MYIPPLTPQAKTELFNHPIYKIPEGDIDRLPHIERLYVRAIMELRKGLRGEAERFPLLLIEQPEVDLRRRIIESLLGYSGRTTVARLQREGGVPYAIFDPHNPTTGGTSFYVYDTRFKEEEEKGGAVLCAGYYLKTQVQPLVRPDSALFAAILGEGEGPTLYLYSCQRWNSAIIRCGARQVKLRTERNCSSVGDTNISRQDFLEPDILWGLGRIVQMSFKDKPWDPNRENQMIDKIRDTIETQTIAPLDHTLMLRALNNFMDQPPLQAEV